MDELRRQAFDHVIDRERVLFLGHFCIEENLQQQVAKFAGKFVPVALVDGFQNFIRFFKGVGLDGIEGLFAIPGAAAGRPQALHDVDGAFEALSCCGHSATNVNDCGCQRQCGESRASHQPERAGRHPIDTKSAPLSRFHIIKVLHEGVQENDKQHSAREKGRHSRDPRL